MCILFVRVSFLLFTLCSISNWSLSCELGMQMNIKLNSIEPNYLSGKYYLFCLCFLVCFASFLHSCSICKLPLMWQYVNKERIILNCYCKLVLFLLFLLLHSLLLLLAGRDQSVNGQVTEVWFPAEAEMFLFIVTSTHACLSIQSESSYEMGISNSHWPINTSEY